MTKALCFKCGEVKFGAICPCPKCQVTSTGDMNLDIAFSDHQMGEETLRELGKVIAAIRSIATDDNLGTWAFIYYVSTKFPTILGVELAPEVQTKCQQLLGRITLPTVTMRPSPRQVFIANNPLISEN